MVDNGLRSCSPPGTMGGRRAGDGAMTSTRAHGGRPMGSDTATGEDPAIAEDTLDLGERLDPVRTLLRRTAAGDRDAASALVDVLGPRIHGLAVHVTGSSARAGRLTVWGRSTCVRDAAQLASGGLPGEAAVLDRARRAAVATRPSGDVRSLVAPDTVTDRTRPPGGGRGPGPAGAAAGPARTGRVRRAGALPLFRPAASGERRGAGRDAG